MRHQCLNILGDLTPSNPAGPHALQPRRKTYPVAYVSTPSQGKWTIG